MRRSRWGLAALLALAVGVGGLGPAAHAVTYPQVVAQYAVDRFPTGVATDLAADRLFVASQDAGTLDILAAADGTGLRSVSVGALPFDVAVHPSTHLAYVTGGDRLVEVDPATGLVSRSVPVGSGPVGLALDTAANRAYVGLAGGAGVAVVDLVTMTVLATVPTGGAVQGVGVDPGRSRVYASDFTNGRVVVIDTVALAVATTITVGSQPQFLAVDSAANRVYVARFGAGALAVVDGATDTLATTVAVGVGAERVALNPALDRIYVTLNGAGALAVLRASTLTLVTTIPVGSEPTGVAAAGARAYVANFRSSSVSVVGEITDVTGPDTTLTAAPSGVTGSASASFSFTGHDDLAADATLTFQCALDAAPFSGCTSPHAVTGLTTGSHTFAVRAVDESGNADPTPASVSWTVDLAAPETFIDSGPVGPQATIRATFAFHGTDNVTAAGALTFECRIDGAPTWYSPCPSPVTVAATVNPAGSHTFEARARDGVGNVDPSPAAFTWTIVDALAPTVSITTASGSLLLNTTRSLVLTPMTGVAGDDVAGIAHVDVSFVPRPGLLSLFAARVDNLPANVGCTDETNTSCGWWIDPAVLPGSYDVWVAAYDRAGKVTLAGPLAVIVL